MKLEKANPAGWKLIDDSGRVYYLGEQGSFGLFGLNQGFIFKDKDAFESGEGICYVGEYGFDDKEDLLYVSDKEGYGYTRKELESLCKGTGINVETLFAGLSWQSPEALLGEWLED